MAVQLIGNSIQIRELRETIKQVAPADISVLITGESGTGKEVAASLLHQLSSRKNNPFITVNCGAIPEGIIESELFGHQKGAFTGAIESREGYFEMADGGTIFLDEIGDMPLGTQVKLLRVIETGQFLKVGGSKNVKVNVRIVAATNKDLAEETAAKNFREDLYYRLKSINLHIPPLRERKEDIKPLFDYFIKESSARNRQRFGGIDEDAMEYLVNYSWPGNIRELKNLTETLLVLNSGKLITLDDVKKHLNVTGRIPNSLPVIITKDDKSYDEQNLMFMAMAELKNDLMDVKRMLYKQQSEATKPLYNENDFIIPKEEMNLMTSDDIEKRLIEYHLKNNNWNIKKVASILNQTERNLYRKLKKYSINK